MALQSDNMDKARPYLLSSPALLFYVGLFLIPLFMTFILSFYSFDINRGGILPGFSFANYAEVLGDSYFHRIFFRTFFLSILVTFFCVLLGTPEAYILHRMSSRWKSLCMLAILGPLLVSVVVRTLGWAILIGSDGVINKALLAIGLIDAPIKLMFTMTGLVIALVHVLIPFMVLSVWASLQKLDPMVEMVAACDVYDALLSPRPYRPLSYDNRTALEELTRMADSGSLGWPCVELWLPVIAMADPTQIGLSFHWMFAARRLLATVMVYWPTTRKILARRRI